ncbi:UNVERIFIED_CONTAM: hypothetical protein NCL1_35564 [Trichonephila clavipes]
MKYKSSCVMQITLKKCGAKYLNGTSCEYRTIISKMCDNPKYSQNECMKNLFSLYNITLEEHKDED